MAVETGGKRGGRQSARKKKKCPAPPRATPSTANTAGRRTTGTRQQRKKKKKAGRSAKKKNTNSEGRRKERRQKGTKRKNRGARCFSHTRCAAHVELQSVTRNEGKRNNTYATNRPQTQLSTDAKKNHNNGRKWVHPTPRDGRHTGPPTKRSTDATSSPDAAGPPTQNQPSPQRSNRQRPPRPPQPSIYTTIHHRDPQHPQRRNFHRRHPSPKATLAARSTHR